MNIILHLGLGSFHRAHQAAYIHALQASGDTQWGLIAGNIRADMTDIVDALISQGGAYTLETISPSSDHRYTRITSIQKVIPYTEDLHELIAQAASPNTKIISFTVTEAGYYLNDQHCIDWAVFADVANDAERVRSGLAGKTIYGALSTLLRARMQSGAGAITLMNCDNLRHNGDRALGRLLEFIERIQDHSLLDWVKANTSSPNAMVDRITPRPTREVRQRVFAATGRDDAAALMSESFTQWVIEDRFVAGRPNWEAVGVEMVASVDAHEEAKIRLLNATHSCIAWAGTLVGYRYIHEGTLNPAIRALAHDYVTHAAIPALESPDRPIPINLERYRDVVLDRFSNSAIQDTNQRVAMDGFSKIPGFIAPTIRDRLKHQGSIAAVAVLPALFLAYLERWHLGALPHIYQDQAMDTSIAHTICASSDPVASFCADPSLWGELVNDGRLVAAMRVAYSTIQGFIQRTALHHA